MDTALSYIYIYRYSLAEISFSRQISANRMLATLWN